jgi:hypothetical protein
MEEQDEIRLMFVGKGTVRLACTNIFRKHRQDNLNQGFEASTCRQKEGV